MHTEGKICGEKKGIKNVCQFFSCSLLASLEGTQQLRFGFAALPSSLPETSRLLSSETEANMHVKYKGFPGIATGFIADK